MMSLRGFRLATLTLVLFGCSRTPLEDPNDPSGNGTPTTAAGHGGSGSGSGGVGGAGTVSRAGGMGGAGTVSRAGGMGGAGTVPRGGGMGSTSTVPGSGGMGSTSTAHKDGGTRDGAAPVTAGRDARTPDTSRDSTGPVPTRPAISAEGLISLQTGDYMLIGTVVSSAGGSGSSITLIYDATSFCASGIVGFNSTYQSWAQAGFSVNQPPSPTGGLARPLALSGDSITLAYANPGGSPLRIQIADASYTYWCHQLAGSASPVTIPLRDFNTRCWDGSGSAFVSGTQIQSIQMVVPGANSRSTPFSFCFEGLAIQ